MFTLINRLEKSTFIRYFPCIPVRSAQSKKNRQYTSLLTERKTFSWVQMFHKHLRDHRRVGVTPGVDYRTERNGSLLRFRQLTAGRLYGFKMTENVTRRNAEPYSTATYVDLF